MANMAQRHTMRTASHSGLSATEWDVVSEGAVSHERMSTGSLSSDESDAVIIFGGPKSKHSESSAKLMSPMHSDSFSAVLNQNIHSLELDDEDTSCTSAGPKFEPLAVEPWHQKHQRLLSAVSDLASDPGLKKVNAEIYGGMQHSMPIEQRLLDQIAKLAEELDESQEQAKLLLLQNDRLMSENDDLKKLLTTANSLNGSQGSRQGSMHQQQHAQKNEDEKDIVRVTFAVAAGLVIIGLAKKKLLLNGMGLLGAAVFGGYVGFLQLWNGNKASSREQGGH